MECGNRSVEQRRLMEQILRRVRRQSQLREDDQCGAALVGAGGERHRTGAVGGRVADPHVRHSARDTDKAVAVERFERGVHHPIVARHRAAAFPARLRGSAVVRPLALATHA